MAQFKCKMCGGSLIVEEGMNVCECEFCGTKQTVPNITDNEKVTTLHNRANTLRLKNEFDKALVTYETIINEVPNDPEAHWGAVLCRYGIEYVDDPKTAKKIPTCHRTQIKSIFDDFDYKACIDNSDVITKGLYEEEAEKIDKIQKSILAISNNEEPFDIFICYKETDNDGNRTKDSIIAQELYDELTKKGLKVFYARITLEDKLGSQYEPYIFSALTSSKIMLVIGTKPEYFNAVWVKNEWYRFLSMIPNSNSNKYIIPCYRDMDAYDLPDELTSFQAQDISKLGFLQDLLRGIFKLLGINDDTQTAKSNIQNSSNIKNYLKRALLFTNDRDFESAKEYCEKALDLNPECVEAYEILLAIENKATVEEIEKGDFWLIDSKNYEKIMMFVDNADKAKYENIAKLSVEKEIEGACNKAINSRDLDYINGEIIRLEGAYKYNYLPNCDMLETLKKRKDFLLTTLTGTFQLSDKICVKYPTQFRFDSGGYLEVRQEVNDIDRTLFMKTLNYKTIDSFYYNNFNNYKLKMVYIEYIVPYDSIKRVESNYFEDKKINTLTIYFGEKWNVFGHNKKGDAIEEKLIQIGKLYNFTVLHKYHPIFNKAFTTNEDELKTSNNNTSKSEGCYVATCVYGSYDCPEVWRLRRYRDFCLDKHWWGRLFIKVYYSISPKLVKWFGNKKWFRKPIKSILDKKLKKLEEHGYDDTPYVDKY